MTDFAYFDPDSFPSGCVFVRFLKCQLFPVSPSLLFYFCRDPWYFAWALHMVNECLTESNEQRPQHLWAVNFFYTSVWHTSLKLWLISLVLKCCRPFLLIRLYCWLPTCVHHSYRRCCIFQESERTSGSLASETTFKPFGARGDLDVTFVSGTFTNPYHILK